MNSSETACWAASDLIISLDTNLHELPLKSHTVSAVSNSSACIVQRLSHCASAGVNSSLFCVSLRAVKRVTVSFIVCFHACVTASTQQPNHLLVVNHHLAHSWAFIQSNIELSAGGVTGRGGLIQWLFLYIINNCFGSFTIPPQMLHQLFNIEFQEVPHMKPQLTNPQQQKPLVIFFGA